MNFPFELPPILTGGAENQTKQLRDYLIRVMQEYTDEAADERGGRNDGGIIAGIQKALSGMQARIGKLGQLAFKDAAGARYTPAGTVSKPSFTGTPATIRPKVTARGTVSKPGVTVTPTKETIYSITDLGAVPSCTLPTLTEVIEGEDLRFMWTDGSFEPGSAPTRSAKSVMTGASAALDSAPVFTGTEVEGSADYTPAGSVSRPSFTGEEAAITVS